MSSENNEFLIAERKSSFDNTLDVKTVDHTMDISQAVEDLAITKNNNTNGVNQKMELRRSINNRQNTVFSRQSIPEGVVTEINSSLLVEIRKLRVQIDKSHEALASESQKHEYAVQQRNQLEKKQEKMKDEVWNLELKTQELEIQLDNTTRKLSRATTEKNRLEKKLDQIHNNTVEQNKLEETNNAVRRQHEQLRLSLVKDIRSLKKENAHLQQQLEKTSTEANLWKSKVALLTNNSSSSLSPPKSPLPPNPSETLLDENTNTTPITSPRILSAKNQHQLESDTLQNSLEHAQQTILNLRSALEQEKLDSIETKKMLIESQETIEDLRRDALTNQSHRRKKQQRRHQFASKRQSISSKRSSIVQISDIGDSDSALSDQDDEGIDGMPMKVEVGGSLFDELQNISGSDNNYNEAQIKDKVDVHTQTDFCIIISTNANVITKDTEVQCNMFDSDNSQSTPSTSTTSASSASSKSSTLSTTQPSSQKQPNPTPSVSHSNKYTTYLGPIKRVLYDTSSSLCNRKSQRPAPITDNNRRSPIPKPTVSSPPSVPSAKQQVKQNPQRASVISADHTMKTTTVATTIGGPPGKSKLLAYASKYNKTITSGETRKASNNNYCRSTVTSPPIPIPSISIATPMHNSTREKLAVSPSASVSDSITTAKRQHISRTTTTSLNPSAVTPNSSNSHFTRATNTATIANSEEQRVVDPLIIQAMTHTMIGNWMWKHTRYYNLNKNGISHRKGHMRYVWVHPYTRTLYWSGKQPGLDHDETKSKRAYIKDVWSVPCTENPRPNVPSNLLIRTAARDLMFHAENMEQHHQWIIALCYLLGRPGDSAKLDKDENSRTSSPLSSGIGGSNSSSHSTAFLNSSIYQADNSNSLQESQLEEDGSDDSEDFINIRQCCNGKHDVSTLARK